MIYLYLNFNPNVDYHNAWTFIAYIVLTLENTEEEDFVFFAYLLQNVLSVKENKNSFKY